MEHMPTDYPSHLYDPPTLGSVPLTIEQAEKESNDIVQMYEVLDKLRTDELNDHS